MWQLSKPPQRQCLLTSKNPVNVRCFNDIEFPLFKLHRVSNLSVLAGKKAKFCNWHIGKVSNITQTTETQTITAREFKNTDPIDIISELYRIRTSHTLDTKYIQMLKEIIDQPE